MYNPSAAKAENQVHISDVFHVIWGRFLYKDFLYFLECQFTLPEKTVLSQSWLGNINYHFR